MDKDIILQLLTKYCFSVLYNDKTANNKNDKAQQQQRIAAGILKNVAAAQIKRKKES